MGAGSSIRCRHGSGIAGHRGAIAGHRGAIAGHRPASLGLTRVVIATWLITRARHALSTGRAALGPENTLAKAPMNVSRTARWAQMRSYAPR
jgi:hypothetical protein